MLSIGPFEEDFPEPIFGVLLSIEEEKNGETYFYELKIAVAINSLAITVEDLERLIQEA